MPSHPPSGAGGRAEQESEECSRHATCTPIIHVFHTPMIGKACFAEHISRESTHPSWHTEACQGNPILGVASRLYALTSQSIPKADVYRGAGREG